MDVGEITIGLSSLILSLLGMFQFFSTYMKTSAEQIASLNQEVIQLEDKLSKELEKSGKSERRAILWENRARNLYKSRKKVVAKAKKYYQMVAEIKKRHPVIVRENNTLKRKLIECRKLNQN